MPATPSAPRFVASLIEEGTIRDALERIRKSEPLGDSPLRNLVLVWQRLESVGPLPVSSAIDVAAREVLFGLIGDNLARLRRLEGLPEPDDTRQAQLAALAADFTWNNIELEVWSALAYRFVYLDLNLLVQDIARHTTSDPRQIRRRLRRGVRRLAEELSAAESAARAEDRRLWRRLKLPPVGYARLFGVDATLADLVGRLTSPGPPWLVVLRGAGGLGKTTLAHAAMREVVEGEGFDDVAWVTLEEPASTPALLGRFARQLGYPHLADESAGDLEQSLRALSNATPTALVLDNADWLDDYPGGLDRLAALVEPGKLLLTVRHWPGSQTPAHVVTLDPLSREAVAELGRHEAEARGIAQAEHLSADALERLYAVMGGNPLAARLAVGQLARLPLERVLENLTALQTDRGVPLFESMFARTWETLGDEARQVALALLLMPNEGAFWEDLALLADLPGDVLDALGPVPRYAIHALTRRFLEQRAAEEPYAPTFERLLRHALARAEDVFEGRGAEEAPAPQSVAAWMQLLRWQAELDVEPELLGQVVAHVAPGARRAGLWERWLAVLEQAEGRLTGAALARARLETGVALRWLGRSNGAAQALEDAVTGFGERGDFAAQAEVLVELGALHAAAGQREEAALAYRRAVETAGRHGARDGHRRALNGLAALALQEDAIEGALRLLRGALDLSPDEPDGQTLSNLGVACLRAGLADEAVTFQQEALACYEMDADLPNRARAHVRLASAYAGRGEYDEARRHFEEGLALMRALGDVLGQARALANFGAAHRQEGRWDDAVLVWRDALALQRHLGDRVGMAYTWYNLGDAQWAAGDEHAARESLAQAAQLAGAIPDVPLADIIASHPANAPD